MRVDTDIIEMLIIFGLATLALTITVLGTGGRLDRAPVVVFIVFLSVLMGVIGYVSMTFREMTGD